MTNDDIVDSLLSHFTETIHLDEQDIVLIVPKLEVKSLKRKEILLEPGQVSRHMRYIVKGSMRSYYLDDNSQEHTLQLGIEQWWINDLYSYLSDKPSKMYVQAIEHSIVVQISKTNLEILYREVPPMSDFFRVKMQRAYVSLQERTIENMSIDAFERYCNFIAEYRDIEQRVPQYMIASYLGITPEFLSFLRKKHMNSLS